MSRFGSKAKKGSWLSGMILPVGFFAMIAVTLYLGFGSLDQTAGAEQLRGAEQAIRRAAVHCYAIEGSYPASLDYLVEKYGILVDEERFLVHYEPMGANLMPTIAVFPIGGVADAPAEEVN